MTLPVSYFDRLYADASDPWSLASRWYEARKYALTLASLPRERFLRGFEPGCSVGVLTTQLANRCDSLLATDVATVALEATRRRVAHQPQVEVARMVIPGEWPEGSFDLIVLSEVGYYLSAADLQSTARQCVDSLVDDGVLVAVHWKHPVTDYPLTGDEVHQALRQESRLHVLARHEELDFVLEVFTLHPGASVAREAGLAP